MMKKTANDIHYKQVFFPFNDGRGRQTASFSEKECRVKGCVYAPPIPRPVGRSLGV
jgi:hypothetical protein